MTTSKTTSKLNAASYSTLMIAGHDNAQKGSLQTVFGLANAIINNGLKKLSRAQAAHLNGWTGAKNPNRKSKDKAERQIAERAKKQASLTAELAEGMQHMPQEYLAQIEALTPVINDVDKFADECLNIVDSIAYFEDEEITTKKQLIEWVASFVPEPEEEEEDEDEEGENGDGGEGGEGGEENNGEGGEENNGEGGEENNGEGGEETTKKPKKKKTEAEKMAEKIAQEALARLMDENPTLERSFAAAEQAATKTQALAVLADAFNDQLKAAKAEIETLRKIKDPANLPKAKNAA